MFNALNIIRTQIKQIQISSMDAKLKSEILAAYYRSEKVLKENLFNFVFAYAKNTLDFYKFSCESDLRTCRSDFNFDPVPKWQAIQKTVDNLSAAIKYLGSEIEELTEDQCKTALEFLNNHKKYLEHDNITNWKLTHTKETINYLEQYYKHLTGKDYE